MKRILLASVGLMAMTALVGTASAADLPRQMPYKAPAYVAPVSNWTGLYVGINGGGGWGKSDYAGINKYDVSGGMIGGTIGYNWQFGTWVLGLEGDADWANIKGSGVYSDTKNEFLSTVRGRVGYAFDRVMPYVTGGLAVGSVKVSDALNSTDKTKAGWTVGAGVEFQFAPQWSAKVEYLYVDLGSVDLASYNTDFYANVVRGGVNYKF
jgi:outer membrane immunogenic protein